MTQTIHEDLIPAPATSAVGRLDQFRRDNVYLLSGLPLALVSFTAVTVATSLAVSLALVVIGVPLLALSLSLARGFTGIERLRLRALGMEVPDAAGPVATRTGWDGQLDAARDRRSWQAVLHAVVTFPIVATTWSLTVGWWATALGGLSYPLWRGALPDGPDDQGLAELLGFTSTSADLALHIGIGVAFALTLVPAIRALAGLQAGLSRAFIAPDQVGRPGVQ